MNESQHHRGPDEGSLHVEPGVGLGHRRLSIIDVATGQQPLFNEDGTVVVVFNGEIYNYQELIPELHALGHVFRTQAATPRSSCTPGRRGARTASSASAACSRSRCGTATAQTLFLARDRLGVKPLYYALLADGTLLFGSELKSLLAHGGLRRDIDPLAVEEYFALGYVPEPRTIFARRSKLPPAHTLTLRRGEPVGRAARILGRALHARQPDRRRQTRRPSCVERLRESVRLRLISEVPLGAFLSGGVDSSAVVAMMAGLSAEPVNTCSIAFDDPTFDEIALRAEVAERYRTRPLRRDASKATTST